MPLLYGEGEVKAFQRLREAIDSPLKGKLSPIPTPDAQHTSLLNRKGPK